MFSFPLYVPQKQAHDVAVRSALSMEREPLFWVLQTCLAISGKTPYLDPTNMLFLFLQTRLG